MEKEKKICAFGLNVHVKKGQQACYIIYFLITFILSTKSVPTPGTHYEFEEGGGGLGESVVYIKNNNKNPTQLLAVVGHYKFNNTLFFASFLGEIGAGK